MQTFTNYINEQEIDLYAPDRITRFNGKPYRILSCTTYPATRQQRHGWGWVATFLQITVTIEPVL